MSQFERSLSLLHFSRLHPWNTLSRNWHQGLGSATSDETKQRQPLDICSITHDYDPSVRYPSPILSNSRIRSCPGFPTTSIVPYLPAVAPRPSCKCESYHHCCIPRFPSILADKVICCPRFLKWCETVFSNLVFILLILKHNLVRIPRANMLYHAFSIMRMSVGRSRLSMCGLLATGDAVDRRIPTSHNVETSVDGRFCS